LLSSTRLRVLDHLTVTSHNQAVDEERKMACQSLFNQTKKINIQVMSCVTVVTNIHPTPVSGAAFCIHIL